MKVHKKKKYSKRIQVMWCDEEAKKKLSMNVMVNGLIKDGLLNYKRPN